MDEIINVSYEDEIAQSYLDYAMTVIVSRALPDIRDGLKPVHRRILFSADQLGCSPKSAFKKSARIVGDILGKYHPHGDASVYEAMVRLAQTFNYTHPLIEGHGNFGSIDGDSAAAMRYTEARLSPISTLFLEDLKYNIVPMRKNFDETLYEPVVLPVQIPALMLNGTSGIAVGMTSNIPPHNLTELLDTIIYKIENPEASIPELLEILHGPDFPTGAIITNKSDLIDIYNTGKGVVKLRSKYHVEELKNGKKQIVVTEIPYTVSGSKENLLNKIIDTANERKELNITEVRDESSKEGIRIVMELKKDTDEKYVINYMFKHTKLQDNMSVFMLAILNQEPKTFNLHEYIEVFLKYQNELYVKKNKQILASGELQVEKYNGLLFGKANLRLIYEITTKAPGDTETEAENHMMNALMYGDTSDYDDISKADKQLISKFRCTEVQANIILDTKLRKLSKINTMKIQMECDKLMKENERISDILSSEKKILNEIKKQLKTIKKDFPDERKTYITDISMDFVEEKKTYNVFVDENFYIKTTRTKMTEPGIINQELQETDRIVVITNLGESILIKPSALTLGDAKFKGIAIENYLPFKNNIMHVFIQGKEGELLYITKDGFAKLVSYEQFLTSRSSKPYLTEENELLVVKEVFEKDTIVYKTLRGKEKTINIYKNLMPLSKRTAKGKKIFTNKDDFESIQIIHKEIPEEEQISLL